MLLPSGDDASNHDLLLYTRRPDDSVHMLQAELTTAESTDEQISLQPKSTPLFSRKCLKKNERSPKSKLIQIIFLKSIFVLSSSTNI